MERAVTVIERPATYVADAQPMRRRRASPEVAMMGIYEISKILSGATRLDQTLANVVNVLSSFFDMRLGMIVILDADGEPEIIATAGWATEGEGQADRDPAARRSSIRLVATATPVVSRGRRQGSAVRHGRRSHRRASRTATSRFSACRSSATIGWSARCPSPASGTARRRCGFDDDLQLPANGRQSGRPDGAAAPRCCRPSASASSTRSAPWRRRSTSNWLKRAGPRLQRSAGSSAKARPSAK